MHNPRNWLKNWNVKVGFMTIRLDNKSFETWKSIFSWGDMATHENMSYIYIYIALVESDLGLVLSDRAVVGIEP
jgi:hypothetical protein